jgi:enterochelin esterase-like enzyme
VAQAASALRSAHTYIWFYSGTTDPLHRQNRAFASELARLHIAHAYHEFRGGHNWALWRGTASRAYVVAARTLGDG